MAWLAVDKYQDRECWFEDKPIRDIINNEWQWKYEGEYYETSCDNTIDADLDEDWHKFCHRCGKFIWYVHSEEE